MVDQLSAFASEVTGCMEVGTQSILGGFDEKRQQQDVLPVQRERYHAGKR